MNDRILGEARDYRELIEVLRARVTELDTTMESVDDLAGLPTRYCSKLLAPAAIKGLGKVSMGAILGALCTKLLLVEDSEALARIGHRLTPRKNAGSLLLAG